MLNDERRVNFVVYGVDEYPQGTSRLDRTKELVTPVLCSSSWKWDSSKFSFRLGKFNCNASNTYETNQGSGCSCFVGQEETTSWYINQTRLQKREKLNHSYWKRVGFKTIWNSVKIKVFMYKAIFGLCEGTFSFTCFCYIIWSTVIIYEHFKLTL